VNLKVLSNSWGSGYYAQSLEAAVAAASNAGLLFVAAAGNDGEDNDAFASYPANFDAPSVMSVAALDHNGNLAYFSNYGVSSVDVGAPGVDILSTVINSSYSTMSGTSMATPFVSGIAALVAAREGTLSAVELKSRLMATVKPLATLNGLMQTPGIVSALNALTNARSGLPDPGEAARYSSTAVAMDYDPNLGQRVLQVDDGYYTAELPFAFSYYGSSFSRIAISSNGRVIPLASGQSAPDRMDYSNSLSQGICVYHDDLVPAPLNPAEGGVWLKTDSSSAVITWVSANYAHRVSSNAETEIRFQLKFNSSGLIEYHYPDTYHGDSNYNYGASASIGLAPVSGVNGEKLTIGHNTANQEQVGSGKALRFLLEAARQAPARSDFDGDGVTDIIVWRPGNGYWFILTSSSGWQYAQRQSFQLGLPGDVPLTGDYDGDGSLDLAVWRPANGTWYFRLSSAAYSAITAMQWGLPGDAPLAGDFDGDGRSDLTVYRAASGAFYTLYSSAGFNRDAALTGNTGAYTGVALGGWGFDPLSGDFNGDGRHEYASVWQLIRFWSIKNTSGVLLWSLPWGDPGDTPLACDLDGDSNDDRIVVRVRRENTLDWYGAYASGGASVNNFGSLGDIPRCSGDYDGDGKGDITVFRPTSGEWFIRYSANGEMVRHQFGLPGDIPL
ncbi:MAG TPA: S8 family serine peptidase, partial [Oligoflexia bacterium]|nr:S8 family serine peptidase [Oligoflexia bacterium]